MKTLVKEAISKRISFDFHGVINKKPELIKKLTDLSFMRDFEVYIVSGGPQNYIKKYLHHHKISYTKLWCIFDFYEQKDLVKFLPNGEFHIDDELWNRAKGDYCRKEKIDLHIDDSDVYGKYFVTPYAHFDVARNILSLPQKDVNLNLEASEIFRQIVEFLS